MIQGTQTWLKWRFQKDTGIRHLPFDIDYAIRFQSYGQYRVILNYLDGAYDVPPETIAVWAMQCIPLTLRNNLAFIGDSLANALQQSGSNAYPMAV